MRGFLTLARRITGTLKAPDDSVLSGALRITPTDNTDPLNDYAVNEALVAGAYDFDLSPGSYRVDLKTGSNFFTLGSIVVIDGADITLNELLVSE